LATPLLEEEDEKGNKETNEISFPKEGFLPTKTLAGFSFFNNSSFNLSNLVDNRWRILSFVSKVCQICKGFLIPPNRRKPSRRFLTNEISNID